MSQLATVHFYFSNKSCDCIGCKRKVKKVLKKIKGIEDYKINSGSVKITGKLNQEIKDQVLEALKKLKGPEVFVHLTDAATYSTGMAGVPQNMAVQTSPAAGPVPQRPAAAGPQAQHPLPQNVSAPRSLPHHPATGPLLHHLAAGPVPHHGQIPMGGAAYGNSGPRQHVQGPYAPPPIYGGHIVQGPYGLPPSYSGNNIQEPQYGSSSGYREHRQPPYHNGYGYEHEGQFSDENPNSCFIM